MRPEPATVAAERRSGPLALVGWTLTNVAIIAAVTLLMTVIFGYVQEAGLGRAGGAVGRSVFGWAIVFTYVLPGVLTYLVLLWLFVPREGEPGRRLRAVLLSPVVAGLLWLTVFEAEEGLLPTIGFALALSIPCGFAVRLPRR